MSKDYIELEVGSREKLTADQWKQVEDYVRSKGLDLEFRIPRRPPDVGVGPKPGKGGGWTTNPEDPRLEPYYRDVTAEPEPTPAEKAHEQMVAAIERGDAYTADQFRKLAFELKY